MSGTWIIAFIGAVGLVILILVAGPSLRASQCGGWKALRRFELDGRAAKRKKAAGQ